MDEKMGSTVGCWLMNGRRFFLWVCVLIMSLVGNNNNGNKVGMGVEGLSCNWGTRSTHPLPPSIAVRLMKDNGFNKVKLFEAEPGPLKALGNSGIQVMLGIPNDFLAPLAAGVRFAEDWVAQNVSTYISTHGVDIRYVAVGNEPFLKTYKATFLQTTLPALKNIQAALIKAGLARQVKVTVPLNADVYQTDTGLPSGGDFRSDIHSLMLSIIKFLSDNGGLLTINIYPFLSLYDDPNFPVDYAFFSGNSSSSIVDGPISYSNVFEANYDTLIWALEKNGFPSLPIVVGEIGWPTDGNSNATPDNARKFNQGLLNRILRGQGTPKRPSSPDIYLFALLDEDAKSVQPGNFERHWGLFAFDGTVKYQLNLGNGRSLVPAKGVRYLKREWCVMSPTANLMDPNLAESVNYACSYADCTSLGYGSSCGKLDARRNASYAFNNYYQTMNQQKGSCQFSNLSVLTTVDPSQGSCRFQIMIDLGKHETKGRRTPSAATAGMKQNDVTAVVLLLSLVVIYSSALMLY
ncbi:glucan endo-1,3-beta-glucosidase 5-like [Malania oleifera]|uniref:glucan endo-1,3-beta-glucosidase 5-like n=1 Tax=Malania oleifera TaxID=397392 RepID=UPI0025ADF119|nr:glucan endo-1,3-beta-glucosidase 5-like [Malania oleifera]